MNYATALQTTTGDRVPGAPLPWREMREMLKSGICPWCARGPWKCVAIHIAKTHDVDRITTRSLALLGISQSISSPEVRERNRQLKNSRFGPSRARKDDPILRKGQSMRAAVNAVNNFPRISNEMVPSIRSRRAAGESVVSIAKELGVTRETVHRALARKVTQ